MWASPGYIFKVELMRSVDVQWEEAGMSKRGRASRNSCLWLQKEEAGTKSVIEELVSAQNFQKQQLKTDCQSCPVKKWTALASVKPWYPGESQLRPAILEEVPVHGRRGQQAPSVKGEMVNILGFLGHAVSAQLLSSANVAWTPS